MPTSTSTDGGNGHKASAQRKEDHRRLTCALDHLRKHTHVLIHGQPPISAQHMNLHWDSWDNGNDTNLPLNQFKAVNVCFQLLFELLHFLCPHIVLQFLLFIKSVP